MDKLYLTPNERLARILTKRSAHQQVSYAPQILPVTRYANERFAVNNLFSNKILISKTAALAHLETTVQDTPLLLKTFPLLQSMHRAYATLCDWDLTVKELKPENDSQQFFVDTFASLPKEWVLDCAAINDLKNQTAPAQPVILSCFTEVVPALQNVIEHWSQTTTVESAKPERRLARFATYQASTTVDEVIQAALWAKDKLEQGMRDIAVVVPDLHMRRSEIYQRFFEVLHADLAGHLDAIDELDFNITAAQPLSAHPIVAAAFDVWRGKPNLYVAKPLQFHPQGVRTYAQWLPVLFTSLEDMEFAFARELSSNEYQALGRLSSFITEMAHAAFDRELSWSALIGFLSRWARQTPFQVESKNEPIQVLGPLEALGQNFSALWFMGATKQAFPPSVSPNPFLPIGLQRDLHMPHASVERQTDFANRLFEDLLHASDEVVFSATENFCTWAKGEPLARMELPPRKKSAVTEYSQRGKPYEQDSLVGGSQTIKLQFACPFRAYMETRHNLAQPEPERLGVPPYVRGKILHDLLAMRTVDEQRVREQFVAMGLNEQDVELETIAMQKALVNWREFEKNIPAGKRAHEVAYTLELAGIKINLRVDRIDDDKVVYDYKMRAPTNLENEMQLPLYALATNAEAVAYYEVNADKAFVRGMGPPFNKTDLAEKKKEWLEQATALVKEYKAGSVERNPDACPCHLANVCRVYE